MRIINTRISIIVMLHSWTLFHCVPEFHISQCTKLICWKQMATHFLFRLYWSLSFGIKWSNTHDMKYDSEYCMILELKHQIQIDLRYIICNRVRWITFKSKKVLSILNLQIQQHPHLWLANTPKNTSKQLIV